ncbi:tetratricopeptide repeat protein [Paraburkholderia hospita]|uniref:O-linked N-acetylglucosamine transferase, SPINDLY family protein n=1 Tax=Paraburkholderia hospita TaxID=169430 RepID=UPI000271CEF0|nr:tetratricopeptide repeat protein [Paraburkholderia hospita]EUC21290.1 Tetratricopeptide repeat-containing protein [Burkholderia sp. BT03]SKC94869.1 Predicted O-linked N-acetylglucosamine transferase, SPINDLY family [Paraburkholderia hospita]
MSDYIEKLASPMNVIARHPSNEDIARAHRSFDEGRFNEAAFICRAVLAASPDCAPALHVLGLVAFRANDYDAASEWLMAAVRRDPQIRYYNDLGDVMTAHNRPAAAAECYRLVIAAQPDNVDAYNKLGRALRAQRQSAEAIEAFCQAIALKPDHAAAYNNLANALVEAGELQAAVEAYRIAINLRPDCAEPRSNLLFALNYTPDVSPETYLSEARRFEEALYASVLPYTSWPASRDRGQSRPLRIGIVSGDLKRHPVGYFLDSVLANIDRSRIEFVAYPTRVIEDDLTRIIKRRFVQWTSLAAMSDEEAARRIRDDGVDVLIDASGHTAHNRLGVFARKAAPVQASWIGYFASTGLRAIDYILCDAQVLPETEEAHFVERPWRLQDSYLCFTPPQEPVEVGPSPHLTQGAVTFGYFGKLGKMTDEVVAVWSHALLSVPGSRLFLKARELDGDYAMREAVTRFAAHGIDGSRLLLEGGSPRAEYLAAYHRVDVMLSPFPYPGGTTTAEALWMGIPVLAMKGDRFLTHVCESMLHAAGLADWIAQDADDYVAKAVASANDTAKLGAIRAALRNQLLASPLCDAPRFARNLEAAFEAMCSVHVDAKPHTP